MFPAMTKWAGDLPQPERIADVLRTAVRAAVSGVPGPAYLGIPADWFNKRLAAAPDLYAEAAFMKIPALRVAPLAQDVERAIALLASAEKPVLLAGGGVMLSEAWAELTALAEALQYSRRDHHGGQRKHRRCRTRSLSARAAATRAKWPTMCSATRISASPSERS